jgi:hypothetical protein
MPHVYVAWNDSSNVCHVDQYPIYNGNDAAAFATPLASFTERRSPSSPTAPPARHRHLRQAIHGP